ncbi:(d)CMP kinase [Sphingomonas prati]|uniref:Cytidylate kinase n=1 Tax=Sphingomonas prati TaxID=1843237 RepID=A0A7W9F361_9SPHN|nr:d(CMP) kinase [Sphingomonas prati]MBB5729170.1 cytidylate kinase [Sphingomonas prati]GGE84545.1 cytidylate kinase [Sphingomonas prati]
MIIAVDGPAASGKGTIARALAAHYRLPYLDTGLLYRAVGLNVVRGGGNPSDPDDALAGCRFDDLLLSDPKLRSEDAGATASIVSAHPAVREALVERQRDFAARPGGAILDGRDIGTVIAPHADAKLFVRASPTVRAQRRHAEMAGMGQQVSVDTLLAEIRERDRRDSTRDTAPLVQAADADLLDTSLLSIETAVQRAIALVDARMAAR